MSSQPSLPRGTPPAAIGRMHVSREFLLRTGLVALFVVIAYQFRWEWLRFATSEAILRVSASLGTASARVSFDTIRIRGQLFRVVIACTFVDVFMGSISLLWNFQKSLLRNASRLTTAALILFAFNVVRLEIAQVLYARGVSWTLADEVLGGFAYFAVWLFIWWQRGWGLTPISSAARAPASL